MVGDQLNLFPFAMLYLVRFQWPWRHILVQSPIKLPLLSNSSKGIFLGIHWDLIICDFVYLNFFFIAPSQPPGNIIWNSSDSKIILNWDQVKALDNESEVKGYKVGNFFLQGHLILLLAGRESAGQQQMLHFLIHSWWASLLNASHLGSLP